MSRRWMVLFSILVLAALVVSACGQTTTAEPTPEPGNGSGVALDTPVAPEVQPPAATDPVVVEPTAVAVVQTTPTTGAAAPAASGQPAGYGTITNRVQSRGMLVCGSRTDLAGFGYLDSSGQNHLRRGC